MTTMQIVADPIPLTTLPDGTIRVSGTRISLDLVLERYKEEATPEEIVESFDTLKLADVHAVISYYLNHKNEVDTYLVRRKVESEDLEKRHPELNSYPVLREKLLKRQKSKA